MADHVRSETVMLQEGAWELKKEKGAMQRQRDIGDRALTMMQALAPIDVGGIVHEGSEHGIVQREDALKALAGSSPWSTRRCKVAGLILIAVR